MGTGRLAPAEEQSRGLDSQIRQLLETLPVGAYACDPEGLITAYNRHALELWGREPKLNDPQERWCGSFKLFSALDGSPIPHDECWMALAIKTGVPQNGMEIVVERPDGRRFVALTHANPIHDSKGVLIGAVNVVVDISDRKRAEETQSRLGAIVESSDDAIVGKTLDGTIVSWNIGAERMFGYSAVEAVGQPITLIIPAELRAEETEILAKLRRGERVEHYETIRVTKDGRRLDISLSSSPIRDSTGRVIGASKVARDVTSRKRDEAALRRLQEMALGLSSTREVGPILEETVRAAAMLQETDLGILSVVDEASELLHVGAVLGFAPDSLQAAQVIRAEHGSCARSLVERKRVIVQEVEQESFAQGYRDAARQSGFRAEHSTPLISRSGKVIGVLSLYFRQPRLPTEREISLIDLCARQAVDFIENARLYQELQDADRAKNEFLAILAHELRNPLAPIRNTVETLHLTGPSAPGLRSALAVIDRQLSLMTRLIDDLLDVSRITRSKLELVKERVDLADVLHAAIETSRPLLTARGHDFGVDLPPEPILLDADPTRLAQVISNLLNNAAKYTERGGRIRLGAWRQGSEAIVSVRDNGIGIPTEVQGRIFEMFTQGDRSLDRSQGGLGIGLHLASRLAGLHGGCVSVQSEGSGKGSEFVLRLSVPSGPAPTQKPLRKDTGGLLMSTPLRILVVDDNRDAADSLGILLAIPGNEVRIAYDGMHAIEMAEEFRPEVILLDIGLPKLDGHETAKRIREQPWGPKITLVALTGWGQEEAKQRSREAGFDAHLVKPVDPALLMRHVVQLRASGAGAGG
jgi:PAS domain S-box-containing protein